MLGFHAHTLDVAAPPILSLQRKESGMSPQPNDVIGINIARRVYEEEISLIEERLMASYVSGCMLWPYVKHNKTRYFYYALCYREIFAVVEKTISGETYAALQYCWVKDLFGSFDAYTQILAGNPLFPSKGKGSLAERAWMGYIAGLVFKLALDEACSLNVAAKAVTDGIRVGRKGNEDILSPSAENIIKNYWPEFLPVAHLWAAMQYFTLPEPADSTVIRLDLATKHPQLEPKFSEGWRGILQVAQGLLNSAAEAPRKQTSRPLLDPLKTATIQFV